MDAQLVNGIDWTMVKAMTGIMSFAMLTIGGLILAATKSIFITKKEFKEHECQVERLQNQINKKLYDDKNITIFMPREEYEKDTSARSRRNGIEYNTFYKEIKEIRAVVVPRTEWEESKAYRERRMDANQRIVCGKIDKVTTSVVDMKKEQGDTNELLSELKGSFETYLKLTKEKHNDI